jgi:hypothetical protein
MRYVYFKITNPRPDLINIGIETGMEFTGQLMPNGGIHFNYFNKIWCHCMTWPGEYTILVDHKLTSETTSTLDGIPVYDVESLYNPDNEEEILVIRVDDLSRHQKDFLNIA